LNLNYSSGHHIHELKYIIILVRGSEYGDNHGLRYILVRGDNGHELDKISCSQSDIKYNNIIPTYRFLLSVDSVDT